MFINILDLPLSAKTDLTVKGYEKTTAITYFTHGLPQAKN
jgi:hypothetical protein